MKAYLIKASAKGEFKKYKRAMGGPPQNIFSVAACTPADVTLEMTDETIDMRVNFGSDADVVALFMSTPDAVRAYEIADKFRHKGKKVVFGGLHASALPEEALEHADAVMIGEAEGIWKQLLNDLQSGALKSRYQRNEPLDLAELKPYPTDLIPLDRYDGVWSVMVSRGCAYHCSFCTVPAMLGKQRYRPVADVVAEIRASGAKFVELHADNLLTKRQYAEELFNALIPLNITWMGETSINLARDEALLELAAKSGLRHVLIGLETPSKSVLAEAGKNFVRPEQVKEKIALFNKHGIEVDSSFIFGFDENDKDIFKETLNYVKAIGIQSIHSVILIPFPGTQVFKQLESEGRLLTRDWAQYDGVHAVFTPKQMSADELQEGAYWFHRQIQKLDKPEVRKQPSGNAPAASATARNNDWLAQVSTFTKWKTVLVILALAAATLKGWTEAWGILFIFWAFKNIQTKEAFLIEKISWAHNPVLFVLITGFWFFSGGLYLIFNGEQLTFFGSLLYRFFG